MQKIVSESDFLNYNVVGFDYENENNPANKSYFVVPDKKYNLLQTLSRSLSDKTYNDLNFLGKVRWNAYKWLAGLVLWWKR